MLNPDRDQMTTQEKVYLLKLEEFIFKRSQYETVRSTNRQERLSLKV